MSNNATENDTNHTKSAAGTAYPWLDQLETVFNILKVKYRHYFYQYGLYRIIPDIVMSNLKQEFKQFNRKLMENTIEMHQVMHRIRKCFGDYTFPTSMKIHLNLYDQIMDEIIVSKIERETIQTTGEINKIT